MQILGPASQDELNLVWLKSEWHKLPFPVDASLKTYVDNPDLANDTENALRACLLTRYREPILTPIPSSANYHNVLIEDGDLANLYVITVVDWFLDSGGTFKLTDTLVHLQPDRGTNMNGPRQDYAHHHDVHDLIPKLANYDGTATDEVLILIADSTAGPYTIIDGTHRAAALLAIHQNTPNTPWRAILIEDPQMNTNHWHIGSPVTQQKINEANAFVANRNLW